MLQVNNEWVYEDLTEKSIIELIETFRRGETPKWGPQVKRNFAEGPEGRTTLINFQDSPGIDRDFAAAKKQWEDRLAEEARKKAEMEAKKKAEAAQAAQKK